MLKHRSLRDKVYFYGIIEYYRYALYKARIRFDSATPDRRAVKLDFVYAGLRVFFRRIPFP
jgi:hypothetical protein